MLHGRTWTRYQVALHAQGQLVMRLPVRACVQHKGAKEDKDFEIAGARGGAAGGAVHDVLLNLGCVTFLDEYGQITEYNRNRQSTIAATIN